MVLPERPAATEEMTEAELASMVTRDSLIGVGLATRQSEAVTRGRV